MFGNNPLTTTLFLSRASKIPMTKTQNADFPAERVSESFAGARCVVISVTCRDK